MWHSWTIEEINAIAPDKLNLLSALDPAMTAAQAQNIFGVNGFMLGGWACLFHGVKDKNMPAFAEASADVKMVQLVRDLAKKTGTSRIWIRWGKSG